uniref:Retrotransposon protein, putative, unclassified n=2 Tax=Oryza sativa subsp. japonica TaxID=39947 RepID=Q850S3_ORYSJ|nr:putative polyprotein [Oryza sativa Japonica Group]ABF97992.1 retrotransposon protein, putative, unclassified [Oryza sativa Japonica Group]
MKLKDALGRVEYMEEIVKSDEAKALVARKENVWIVDSGCSRHMTSDKYWFFSLKQASKTEPIIFGDASTSVVLATGCVKCFVLKYGNLDKFETRSTDGMFLGYPAHSRGYRVLVLETNKIVETCEITFDEPSPGERTTRSKIYVDDIYFGCSTHAWVAEFTETMHREFEMSMMDGQAVDQKEYRSMIGSLLYLTASRPNIQFVIRCLISISKDYGLTFENVPLFYDNTSAINIAKNPVQHSRTKHIDIRFDFLRDHVEKEDVELTFLDTNLLVKWFLEMNRYCWRFGPVRPGSGCRSDRCAQVILTPRESVAGDGSGVNFEIW